VRHIQPFIPVEKKRSCLEHPGLISSSQFGTPFFCLEGDASQNRGTAGGLRHDGNLAFHQLDSFAHADEPQAPPTKGILRIKAHAVVTDGELNLSRTPLEFHAEVPHTAVLNRILQGFL
jgi:hypothetical protein